MRNQAILILTVLFVLSLLNFIFRMPVLNISDIDLLQVLVIGFFGGALSAIILTRVSEIGTR